LGLGQEDDEQGELGEQTEMTEPQKIHLMETLKAFYLIKSLNEGGQPLMTELRTVKLAPSARKLLVLDMDETLIHAIAAEEVKNYPVQPDHFVQF